MNSCYENAKVKYDELMNERLMGYQKASVEAICNHFETHKMALLADEVGLGKTEVAKGVIAKMALRHWEQNKTENNPRPFRVAYVCPNLNIAQQNFPKLNLYKTNIFEGNTDLQKTLQSALETYKCEQGIKKNSTGQRAFIRRSSVYTRLCEWLIEMCQGSDLEAVMGSDVRGVYLSTVDSSDEWNINHNKKIYGTNICSETLVNRADVLRQSCINAIKENVDETTGVILESFWRKAQKEDKNTSNKYYAFNKQAAKLFTAAEADYRLSMQHLDAVEARTRSRKFVMQIESITPQTSFYIDNKNGTMRERALLQASCESRTGIQFDEEIYIKKFCLTDNIETYNVHLQEYRSRIKSVESEIDIPPVEQQELEGTNIIPALRTKFVKYNLENNIHYDLIIMDEFQNYPYVLVEPENSAKDEVKKAYERAQMIIQKSNNVMLLSATPFEFAKLVNNQLSENGVFRTERIAASKHSPVIERARLFKVRKEDFIYTLKANNAVQAVDDAEDNIEEEPEDGNKKYRSRYSWTTPYALTFMGNYASSKEFYNNYFSDKSIDSTLFLSEEMLINPKKPIALNHQCFEAMQREIFGKDNKAAYMLWIPPCGCETKLKGAFEGMGGFSKTLIFAEYKMTPMAFSYLLCAEAKRILSNSGEYKKEDEIDREKIKLLINDKMKGIYFERTSEELSQLFTDIFTSEAGYLAVRKFHSEKPYFKAVDNYCNDGCFGSMIKEYVELLKGEYGDNDNYMALAVRRAGKMAAANAKLWFCKENQNEPYDQSFDAPNKFASGIFDDGQKGIKELKSAFNSPVWPFVLSTTSVGTEGIDLHWYARHVVHWSVPSKYTDIEQREGRVLRYKCHAYRLNEHLAHIKEQCIKDEWKDSGMGETQLNFFAENEFDINASEKGGCYHVTRDTYFYRFSSEEEEYKLAKDTINEYRRKLGQEDGIVRTKRGDENIQPSNTLCLAPWFKIKRIILGNFSDTFCDTIK